MAFPSFPYSIPSKNQPSNQTILELSSMPNTLSIPEPIKLSILPPEIILKIMGYTCRCTEICLALTCTYLYNMSSIPISSLSDRSVLLDTQQGKRENRGRFHEGPWISALLGEGKYLPSFERSTALVNKCLDTPEPLTKKEEGWDTCQPNRWGMENGTTGGSSPCWITSVGGRGSWDRWCGVL